MLKGFRHRAPLVIAGFLCAAAFAAVLWVSAIWPVYPALVLAILLALVAMSLYAAHLLDQRNSAVDRLARGNAPHARFLARVSHELRVPLTGIRDSMRLLRASRHLSAQERSLLGAVEDSLNGSLRLVDNLLDFSGLLAGKLTTETTDIDLHELVNGCAATVRPAATESGLQFLVRISPDVPYYLRGDAHHVRQVLLNLLSNAVKFTQRGSVWLDVANQKDSPTRATIRFEIRDTGTGISPEALDHIFEGTRPDDTSNARHLADAPLGITIAKRLVDLMGGRIGVESAEGHGTTLWLEIPFDKRIPPAEPAPRAGARVVLLSPDAGTVDYYRGILGRQLVCIAAIDDAINLLGRAVRLGNAVHVVMVDATIALGRGGSHRCADLCKKAASSNMSVVLIADQPPPAQRLREWGYHAVLSRTPERRLVDSVLHASPHRLIEADSKVVSVPPWLWGGREEASRPRVLVADDNRTNLMITRRMLEQAGYSVDAVQTGDQALERLRAGGYRVAVLDMHMPGLDGPSVLRRYHLMRPRSRLPIIVLTANASIAAQHACADAGADAYLAKPVTAQQLVNEIRRLLDDTAVEMLPREDAAGSTGDAARGLEQVLDLSVLAELDRIYSDQHELGVLAQEYEREGREFVQQIAAACGANDHAGYCDAVHSLKSNAANVGARQLMEVCRAAGTVSSAEFARDRDRLLQDLDEAFLRSLAALREIARNPPHEGAANL